MIELKNTSGMTPRSYDEMTRSIRECLVTYPEWAASVAAVEGPLVEVPHLGPGEDRKLLVPYPFTEPIVLDYITERYGHLSESMMAVKLAMFTDEDRAACSIKFGRRVHNYLSYAMSQEQIAMFDDDFDTGCFIHNTSGVILPFKYDLLKDVTFYQITDMGYGKAWYNSLIRRISADGDNDENTRKELMANLNVAGNMMRSDKLSAFYTVHFNVPHDPYYNSDSVSSMLTYVATLSDSDLSTIHTYVRLKLGQHAKCLCLP